MPLAAFGILGCGGHPLGGGRDAGPPRFTPPVTLAEVSSAWNLTADAVNLYWATTEGDPNADLVGIPQAGGAPFMVGRDTGFFTFMVSDDGWIYGTDLDLVSRLATRGGDREAVAHAGLCYVGTVTPSAVWCGFGQGLTRVDREAGTTARVGESLGYVAVALAVDDVRAYWTAGGALLEVDQSGGPTRTLLDGNAAGGPWPVLIGLDDRSLYVATTEAIVRVDKATGAAAPLRRGLVNGLAVRKGMIFWSEPDTARVGATPAAGGPDIVIAEGETTLQALVASDAGVFWLSEVSRSAERSLVRGSYFVVGP